MKITNLLFFQQIAELKKKNKEFIKKGIETNDITKKIEVRKKEKALINQSFDDAKQSDSLTTLLLKCNHLV